MKQQHRHSRNARLNHKILFLLILIIATVLLHHTTAAQPPQYIRIARIVVDSVHLESYKAALKEEITTSVKAELGVITLYGVYDKKNPTQVTMFEIYASEEAYQSHIQTLHFKKYKTTVEKMVKSLELIDVAPIALEDKPRIQLPKQN